MFEYCLNNKVKIAYNDGKYFIIKHGAIVSEDEIFIGFVEQDTLRNIIINKKNIEKVEVLSDGQ